LKYKEWNILPIPVLYIIYNILYLYITDKPYLTGLKKKKKQYF